MLNIPDIYCKSDTWRTHQNISSMNLAGYLFLFAAFLHFANATPLPVNETCEAVHPEPLSKYSTDVWLMNRSHTAANGNSIL